VLPRRIGEFAARPNTEVRGAVGKIEKAEIAQLDRADADAFRAELGITSPPRPDDPRVLSPAGEHLVLTAGEDECRAWTIRRGTYARQAAGSIHSDIEKGSSAPRLCAYDDLVAAGTWRHAATRAR